MADVSPFDALVDAFRDAKLEMSESVKAIKADIISPLDPNATKRTRAERNQAFDEFLVNPDLRESEFLRLAKRYNLTKDRPIPRRLVEYVCQGIRDQKKADYDQYYHEVNKD